MTALSKEEWSVVAAFNEPMPLESRPFARVAERAGCSEAELLELLRTWLDSGVIRRFGARVRHRDLGYRANGMSVWRVPEGRVEEVAGIMAAYPEVSHCYERPTFTGWPYNLYGMVHGTSRKNVEDVVRKVAKAAHIHDYTVLYSTKEYKKTRPRFTPPVSGRREE
jgi:DNA-binding Lrp family transcriptional regulator